MRPGTIKFIGDAVTGILAIAIFISTLGARGQSTFVFADHKGIDRPSNVVTAGSRSFFLVIRQILPVCCGNTYPCLVAAGPNGNVLFDTVLPAPQISSDYFLAATADDHLLATVTVPHSCDVADFKTHIWKLDTLGNILWKTVKPGRTYRTLTDTGSVYYLQQSDLLLAFHDTTLVDTVTKAFQFLGDADRAPGGRFVVCFSSGAKPHLAIIDSSGAILKQKQVTEPVTGLTVTNDLDIFGVSYGKLVLYDSTLTLKGSTGAQFPPPWDIKTYALDGNVVYAAAQYSNDQLGLITLNANLVSTNTVMSNVRFASPTGILKNNNGWLQVLAAVDAEHDYFSLLTQLPGLAPKLTFDAGVADISVVSTNYHLAGKLPSVRVQANVVVKNYGADPIHSFRLQHYSYNSQWIINCFTGLNRLYEVDIAPGGTVTVATGSFLANVKPDNAGNATFTLCLTTPCPISRTTKTYQMIRFAGC